MKKGKLYLSHFKQLEIHFIKYKENSLREDSISENSYIQNSSN
jgi:hypothetical protein